MVAKNRDLVVTYYYTNLDLQVVTASTFKQREIKKLLIYLHPPTFEKAISSHSNTYKNCLFGLHKYFVICMSLYYSTASFSKTLICFSGVCNYVKAERFSEPGTHSYVHASICIHYSGILRHKVKHAKGSGRSCMHLITNPTPTLSWTRSYCKKKSCPRAFATAHIFCLC